MNNLTAAPTTPRRSIALLAAAAALAGMGALAACGTKDKPADTKPPMSSMTESVPPSPTEKAVKPAPNGSMPNGSRPTESFAPTAKARPAPTALPGNVITGG